MKHQEKVAGQENGRRGGDGEELKLQGETVKRVRFSST